MLFTYESRKTAKEMTIKAVKQCTERIKEAIAVADKYPEWAEDEIGKAKGIIKMYQEDYKKHLLTGIY